jgi:V/A-type H+-transporting ATPase subunit I
LGVAQLSKVTVLAPRSDYQEVIKRLSKFQDFHSIEDAGQFFDPVTQDLAVRAVRLFTQADQLVKDLSIPLVPGTIDTVFKGVSISQTEYYARNWGDLLDKAEKEMEPIRIEVKATLSRDAQLAKEESDTQALIDALRSVANISADLGRLNRLKRVKAVLVIAGSITLLELQKSLPDAVFISQPISEVQSLILIASPVIDASKVDKVLKTFELKPLTLPDNLPQNPAEAYKKLSDDLRRLGNEKATSELELARLKENYATKLLAIRELTESAHIILDEVRKSGGLARIAISSGYIPTSRQSEFVEQFNHWVVYHEQVSRLSEYHSSRIPTLLENKGLTKPFEEITRNQGYPGGSEVDPTPIVSLVFPVFFGMMFGDLGNGIVVTAFALLLRQRGVGNVRQWGNIFLATGISSCVMGLLVGEFFGFPLYELVKIPPAVEIVLRPPHVQQATLNPAGTTALLILSIFIGIAHIITGLSLNVVQALRARETVDLLTHKMPLLIMYISGIGFGFSFIGAGYSFNVFQSSNPVPLVGVPTSTLGTVSVAIVLVAMITLALGRGIAIMAGRIKGESVGSAIANGGIEVFEAISSFLANTISYVRLAIMLFVHSALLLTVNMLLALPLYISIVPVIIFNILIIVFEMLIVYIQDLRLHIYEFFTKFYEGRGEPFRKLFPDRVRIRINWT